MGAGPFEEIAGEYDEWYVSNEYISRLERKAIEAMELEGMGLDVGVGTGILSQHIGVFVGLDPSPSMLKQAEERGIHPVIGKGEHLPFRDQSFDFVLMVTTLCFVDSVRDVFCEAHRVLKAGGLLGTCIIPPDSAWGQYYLQKKKEGHRVYKHADFLTVGEVRRLLSENKFELLEMFSTLHGKPGSEARVHKDDDVVRRRTGGSYVCLKVRRA